MRFPERKALLAELSGPQRDTLRRATLRGQGGDEAARVAGCSRRHAIAMREHLVEVGVLPPAGVPGTPAPVRPADPAQIGLFG
jgi:hypothetical protein